MSQIWPVHAILDQNWAEVTFYFLGLFSGFTRYILAVLTQRCSKIVTKIKNPDLISSVYFIGLLSVGPNAPLFLPLALIGIDAVVVGVKRIEFQKNKKVASILKYSNLNELNE